MKKRIVILGAGESGVGSAVLAQKQGYDLFVSDSGTIKDKYRQRLISDNIPFEEGSHTLDLILNAD
jgi:UDP-N-acetylmuramoylalanine--D-glutamate ligase